MTGASQLLLHLTQQLLLMTEIMAVVAIIMMIVIMVVVWWMCSINVTFLAMSADAMRQADTIKMHDTVDDTLLAQPRHTSVQSTGTRRREAVQADHSGDSTPTHIAAVAIGRPFPLTTSLATVPPLRKVAPYPTTSDHHLRLTLLPPSSPHHTTPHLPPPALHCTIPSSTNAPPLTQMPSSCLHSTPHLPTSPPTTSTNLISSASLLLSISTSTSTFNPTPPHPTPPHPHVCPMPAPHTPHFTQRNSFNQLHHSQPSHSITSSIHTYIPTTTSHPPIPPPTYPPAGLPACLPSYLPTFLPSYASSRQLSAPYFGHTSFSALLIKMSQYMHLSHSRGGKRHEERRRREEEEKRRRGEEEKRKGMRRMQPSILSLSSFCRNIHICTRPRVHSTSDMCDAMTGASQLLPPSDAAAAADDGDHGGRRNYHDDSDNGGGVVDVQH
ncbi:hypothetical protein TcWFU_003571 [Taenia crassiceps]|uniref:Uncharacterized protein n=1 Tax=Taenia crassiceps TaxID=6207 RepID=A0ABR4QD45_9CEST